MSDVVVQAQGIGKSFRLMRSERTLFLALRALMTGRSLHSRHTVLERLTFDIRRGERIAVLGGNGAGKSTLLRLIAGILSPSAGTLELRTESSGVFAGETGLYLDLSVIENIPVFGAIHGVDSKLLKSRKDEILALAGLTELRYALAKELSSGQRRRLALSIFFQCPHDLIIMDEALAHVDASFGKKCEEHFDRWTADGKTIILVTHDLDFIRRKCDRAIWLEGKVLRAAGPAPDIVDAYERCQNELSRP